MGCDTAENVSVSGNEQWLQAGKHVPWSISQEDALGYKNVNDYIVKAAAAEGYTKVNVNGVVDRTLGKGSVDA
jgi:hypothetical protein